MSTTAAPTAPPHRAPEAALEAWNRALTDPLFSDLPFKVETTATGQFILTPPRLEHNDRQYQIARLLDDLTPGSNLPPGKPSTEVAVETRDGLKVVDVAWISEEIRARRPAGAPTLTEVPEITVEVRSPDNSAAELEAKRDTYLKDGAVEVWICEEDGRMRFHGPDGALERSALVPDFPTRVPTR